MNLKRITWWSEPDSPKFLVIYGNCSSLFSSLFLGFSLSFYGRHLASSCSLNCYVVIFLYVFYMLTFSFLFFSHSHLAIIKIRKTKETSRDKTDYDIIKIKIFLAIDKISIPWLHVAMDLILIRFYKTYLEKIIGFRSIFIEFRFGFRII